MLYTTLYMESKRPRIKMDDDTEGRIEQYAKEHGYTKERAYYELLREGVESVEMFDNTGFDTNTTTALESGQ